MSRYELSQIMDDTGTTDTDGKVLIERLYGEPPIVVFQSEIAKTIEPYAVHAPDENYHGFHKEIQNAWDRQQPWAEPYARAIGVKVSRLDPNHYEEEN